MPLRTGRARAAAAVACALATLLTACSSSGSSSSGGGGGGGGAAPAADSPFVHAITTDVNSLDPANTLGDSDQEISHNIYERLLAPKWKAMAADGSMTWDGLEAAPQLASSWDIAGPVITFHLRSDVKFYPSKNPLTAADVVWSFQRLTQIVGNGQFQAGVAGIYKPDQITAVDDHTVKITYTDPAGKPAAVPVALASERFQQFAIVDSVEAKKHVTSSDPWAADWLKTHVAGSGPYYLDSRKPNEEITLKAVPDHWTGEGYTKPYYSTVVLRIIGNADVVSLLKSGSVQYAAADMTARQITDLGNSGFQVLHGNVPDIMRLSMAADSGPTADKAVRQALMHAIPYDKIINTALAGRGERADSFVNPDDKLGTKNWQTYDFDPAKTKSLLASAGKGSLAVNLWYTADLAYYQDIALLIKDAMAQAGVTITLKPTPGTKLQDMTMARAKKPWGKDAMDGMYLSDAVIWLDDPETHIDLWGKSDSPYNWPRYVNPEVDKLHQQFRKSSDATARADAYKKVQADLAEDAVVNPLIVLGRTVVTPPGLQGINFMWGPYAMYEYLRPAKK